MIQPRLPPAGGRHKDPRSERAPVTFALASAQFACSGISSFAFRVESRVLHTPQPRPHVLMLHELFLLLSGNPSSLITPDGVPTNFPVVSPSERYLQLSHETSR